MNETTLSSTPSVIDLNPTLDPEIKEYIKDGFFLSAVVLLFLYILKVIYVSMILFNDITATDKSQSRNYPPKCSLICDIISAVLLIIAICLGIYSLYSPGVDLILGIIYLSSVGSALFNDFITLISVCNSETHNEFTLSYGLISMAIVITESLSLNVGGFHVYYSFLKWQDDNRDKEIRFW